MRQGRLPFGLTKANNPRVRGDSSSPWPPSRTRDRLEEDAHEPALAAAPTVRVLRVASPAEGVGTGSRSSRQPPGRVERLSERLERTRRRCKPSRATGRPFDDSPRCPAREHKCPRARHDAARPHGPRRTSGTSTSLGSSRPSRGGLDSRSLAAPPGRAPEWPPNGTRNARTDALTCARVERRQEVGVCTEGEPAAGSIERGGTQRSVRPCPP